MCYCYLEKRNPPARAVVAPESHNWRRLLLLHASDFGPYCSLRERAGLTVILDLRLPILEHLIVTPPALLLASPLKLLGSASASDFRYQLLALSISVHRSIVLSSV
jgi:hypothetical protein